MRSADTTVADKSYNLMMSFSKMIERNCHTHRAALANRHRLLTWAQKSESCEPVLARPCRKSLTVNVSNKA